MTNAGFFSRFMPRFGAFLVPFLGRRRGSQPQRHRHRLGPCDSNLKPALQYLVQTALQEIAVVILPEAVNHPPFASLEYYRGRPRFTVHLLEAAVLKKY